MNNTEEIIKELKDLQPGDKVVLSMAWGSNDEIREVDRVTNTQIVIGYNRFRKDSGYIIGAATRWSGPRKVRVATKKDEVEVMVKWRLDILRSLGLKIEESSPDLINEVYIFLDSKNLLPK